MAEAENVVRLRGVTKAFGRQEAVSDLEFDLPAGTITGLLGPNGSGKTTTIRMILGILMPDRGTVAVFGQRPGRQSRTRAGYLPEERGLYRKMKVLDQLVFFGRIRGMARQQAAERAREWLRRLGLGDREEARADELSRGMQQKVQFIATVLHDPDLLVLDEPFSGLDPINQDVLERIVLEYHQRGATILLSTHLMDQAERICQRVCLISGSRKVLDGDLAEIKRRERSGVVAIAFEGPDSWLSGPGVHEVMRTNGGARVVLEEGADPGALLTRGLAAGARFRRFEVLEPRLHELFLRHAGSGERRRTGGKG